MKKTITRFAPSPTGDPHIGNIRTALFEYLFARSQGGEFLLRIEDTDRERFVEGGVERILESLKWLGIVPDNIDSYPTQSDRLEVYKKHALDLVTAGHAYVCTCSKEKLAEDHERQINENKPPRYEGYCRDAGHKIEDLEAGSYVIRMKVPENRKIVIDDLIRGKVEFETSLLDDQIILKSDGFPTYHLAVVVDDHEMNITHVIRGEEWLPSTPKHILLYEYFGWEPTCFAHLPVILGSDKKKLSKRHGATSALGYKELGYLPEALVNFLALLGWNPKDDREIFSLAELEKEFKLENVNKAPAIFDSVRLDFFNEHYLREKSIEELKKLIGDYPAEALQLVKRGGYATTIIAKEYLEKLFRNPDYDPALLVFKKSNKEATLRGIKGALGEIQGIIKDDNGGQGEWTEEGLQAALLRVVEKEGLTNGDVFWPVRVALSGEEKSPSPVELLLALGKERSTKRLEVAIKKI